MIPEMIQEIVLETNFSQITHIWLAQLDKHSSDLVMASVVVSIPTGGNLFY